MTNRATLPSNVEFRRGDLFASGADTLVNPVNCVGVMGAGLALQFKRRYPTMFADYVALCRRGQLLPGQPVIWDGQLDHRVLNFPTKRHWRDPSQLEDIDAGLQYLASRCAQWDIRSITVPPLGCGLGGLPWFDVRGLIVGHLGGLDARVLIYGQPPSA